MRYVRIDNFIFVMVQYIICSINFVENNLFSPKLKQFLKLFFIYLSQKIYHHYYLNLFDWYIIPFLKGSIFWKIMLTCVILAWFFFPIKINYLSFKYIIQNFHFLKRDYYIYNFSYHRSSFELLIEFCLLI